MSLSWMSDELERLEAEGLRRYPSALSTAQEPEVVLGGRRVVLLCSNNYLGLAADPRVVEAAVAAAKRWGAGAGASRLVSGTTELHLELETAIAALKGVQACVLYSSGYLANIGTICTLVGRQDAVLSDELNHASIIDGCRLSGARRAVYRHADPAHLDELLGAIPARRHLVVTDGVFSMDGDVAPLRDLAAVCDRHGAMLMVDEAHATGLMGPSGAGAVEAAGLRGHPSIVVMGTLSKSLGSAGGYIAGSRSLVDLLRNRSRTHVFDTAPPPAAVGAAVEALRIVRTEPDRRARVLELSRRLAGELTRLGYDARTPDAAVVPVVIGDDREAVALSARLLEHGVFVPAIRPPSVPPGTARLRVTVMATHTDDQVASVIEAFKQCKPAAQHKRAASSNSGKTGAGGVDPAIVAAGGVFVTGTDTNVGKTVVAAAMARALRSRGLRVGAIKPVQTGTATGDDDLALMIDWGGVPPSLVRGPYAFREPLAPSVAAVLEGDLVDPGAVLEAYGELRDRCDVIVVEGAGGLLVPVTPHATMADLAASLGLPLVVVARPGLGTINHTALTVEAARARGLSVVGLVISGFPEQPGLAESTNPAEIERLTGVAVTGVVPMTDQLDADASGWLAPGLGGTFDREAFLSELERRRLHDARA